MWTDKKTIILWECKCIKDTFRVVSNPEKLPRKSDLRSSTQWILFLPLSFLCKTCFIIRTSQQILLGISWDMIEMWATADWEARNIFEHPCPLWKHPHYSPLLGNWLILFPLKIYLQFHLKLWLFISPAFRFLEEPEWFKERDISVLCCFESDKMGEREEGWQSLKQRWITWTGGDVASSPRMLQV